MGEYRVRGRCRMHFYWEGASRDMELFLDVLNPVMDGVELEEVEYSDVIKPPSSIDAIIDFKATVEASNRLSAEEKALEVVENIHNWETRLFIDGGRKIYPIFTHGIDCEITDVEEL